MNNLLQDLRYALRMLKKNPGFTAIAVLTLALGIGANTAIFSVVNGVLLRPLPYNDPDRIVRVFETWPEKGLFQRPHSAPNYVDLKEQNEVFEQFAAYSYSPVILSGDGNPERVLGARITHNLFPLLGVVPILGRNISLEDNQPGSAPVALLSHSLWRRRFGADPNVLGQAITIDGNSYTIIGVLPAGFRFYRSEADVWVSYAIPQGRMQQRGWRYLWTIARLKQSITPEQAEKEIASIFARLEKDYPKENQGRGVRLVSFQEDLVGDTRPALAMLFTAVGFVLAVACANVANLMLVRASSRRKEIAIRAALGAGRSRLIRQVLTESLMLSALGGIAGWFVALWSLDLIVALSPEELPRLEEIGIDLTVLGFTLAISLFTGLLFGLVPALQTSQIDLSESLKEGDSRSGTGARQHRLRSAFVIAEVALALMLLIGAGLMVNSFIRLRDVNAGFQPENLLTGQISLPSLKYREDHQILGFYREVINRVESLPGVESVAGVFPIPLAGGAASLDVGIEGKQYASPDERPDVQWSPITPDYFRAMGIPLLKGRAFTERDDEQAPNVIIINEKMARIYWPGEDPIGKRLTIGFNDITCEIVGVVGSVKRDQLAADFEAEIYTPVWQTPLDVIDLVIRASSDPMSLTAAVRKQILEVDKDIPIYNVASMEEVFSRSIAQPRFFAVLLSIFGAVALILASIGVYGVMAYTVNQRSHEIGIRIAIGARPHHILRMIVRQGLVMASLGVALGLVGAAAVTRFLERFLFGVTTTDIATFSLISFLLIVVAILACYIPARRATKVDPTIALRYE